MVEESLVLRQDAHQSPECWAKYGPGTVVLHLCLTIPSSFTNSEIVRDHLVGVEAWDPKINTWDPINYYSLKHGMFQQIRHGTLLEPQKKNIHMQ